MYATWPQGDGKDESLKSWLINDLLPFQKKLEVMSIKQQQTQQT
jgi:hypothetical protein